MKTLHIILAFFIVVGLLLLVTQKYWLSLIVKSVPEWQTDTNFVIPAKETENQNATTTQNAQDTWNWVYATTSASGIKFMYPDPIKATYVSPVDWPPQVMRTSGVVSCIVGDMASHSGEVTTSIWRTINNRPYCVSVSRQGAAGTTYTAYQYATQHGDFVSSVSFTLKTPQCMNYDTPLQQACIAEQTAFNVDALAERIIQSIIVQ